jgi:hypothetical protein
MFGPGKGGVAGEQAEPSMASLPTDVSLGFGVSFSQAMPLLQAVAVVLSWPVLGLGLAYANLQARDA